MYTIVENMTSLQWHWVQLVQVCHHLMSMYEFSKMIYVQVWINKGW